MSESNSDLNLEIPVFDADNHLYEPKEALNKFLPERYKGVIDYIDVRGLAHPPSYVNELKGAADSTVSNIMGGNLARLMNVPNEVIRL